MKFSTKKLIYFAISIAFIAVLLIFRDFLFRTSTGMIILIVLVLAMFGTAFSLLRCPHCGSYLRRMTLFTKFCPYCGKDLDEKPTK
ncbi:MAG: zinc ribbon domain-containing protein [Clostridia bacterium]|nr:zinc ribbon domain-containing protein [Clostridia bacterium]